MAFRPGGLTGPSRGRYSTSGHSSMIIPELRTQRPSNRRGLPSAQVQALESSRPPNTNARSSTAGMPPPVTPPPTGPILKVLLPWQSWPELTVRVSGLQYNITTWHLWKEFTKEGNVVFIEIFEHRQGGRDTVAKIRFSPVPHHDFWSSGPFQIKTMDGQGDVNTIVTAEPKKRSGFEVQSPVRKAVWYPRIMSLCPSAIGFGLMHDKSTMMIMHQAQCLDRKELTFDVDFSRRRITAKFQLAFKAPQTNSQLPDSKPIASGGRDQIQNYMFQIPFAQLEKIFKVEVSEAQWALIIMLDSPPQFYRKRLPGSASHPEDVLVWTEFDTYLRQTDIVHDREHLKTSAIALNKEMATIDIGRWTTYRFLFDKARIESGSFEQLRNALQDFNVEVIGLENFSLIPSTRAAVWSLLDSHKSHDTGMQLSSLEGLHQGDYTLPFDVRYQLEACISNNIINEHNITPGYVQALADLANKDATTARRLLERFLDDDKRIFHPMALFESEEALPNRMKDLESESKVPDYCALVRKATITPTTMYLSSPTVETSNRIIRKYSEYGDRFLRVQFTDEKFEGRINSCADKVRNDEIYTRVYRTLTNGIRIGGRHYEFLAFGNSQFRENGAYFFSPTENLTCAMIRHWMGDFRHITVVAKCAARLGQCFSTTRAIGGRVQILPIEDVERNGYCFTDGVGKISNILATRIAHELGLPTDVIPSVFQFRMGGCKGILAVSPEVKGQQVLIRKSQSKFTAIYNGLEIIRCSRHAVATLNRQTITILSSLGVPDRVFNKMLLEQLSVYNQAMTDKSLALEKLAQYIDDNHVTVSIAKMILDGFMDSEEPFLVSLLHLWRAWSIKMLKEKARIVVEKGAHLLGCTDETGTLRGHVDDLSKFGDDINPNHLPQIFAQIQDPLRKDHYKVIEGTCFIGRNPSLHPGDIRVVQAVDVPALHHLRDVIVFPQLGDRDITNMCSGGDLDGDDFFVIWDPELRPREVNCAPMDYKAPRPIELDRLVEIPDIMRFFVRYMKNDSLPKIAHAHLAYSDFLDQGVKDPKCIELAHLHSKAVDYVKTGEPALMPKSLNPRQWPHFMEKKSKREYISGKILGQLYDQVQRVDFIPSYEAPFDIRILNAYPADSSVLKTVRQIKTQYDTAVRRIMAQQEIKTEFEVWSTFVLSKPRVGTDYKTQENIGIIGAALKDRFRTICIKQAGAETAKDFCKMGPFVASMYQVSHEEMQIALRECRATVMVGGKLIPKRKLGPEHMPLISFPWLFHDVLGRIATGIADHQRLEDLGLSFLTTKGESRTKRKTWSNILDDEDIIETSEGVILHRGEVLDMSWSDNVDSEGDDVEQPYHQLMTISETNKREKHVKPAEFDPLYDVSPPTSPKQRAVRLTASLALEPSDFPQPASANLLQSLPNNRGLLVVKTGRSQTPLEVLRNLEDPSITSLENLSASASELTQLKGANNHHDLQPLMSDLGQLPVISASLSSVRHSSQTRPSLLADLGVLAESSHTPNTMPKKCTDDKSDFLPAFALSMRGAKNTGIRTSSLVDLEESREKAYQISGVHTFHTPGSENRKSFLIDLEEMMSMPNYSPAPKSPVEEEEVILQIPKMASDFEMLAGLISKGKDKYHVASYSYPTPTAEVSCVGSSISRTRTSSLGDLEEMELTVIDPEEEAHQAHDLQPLLTLSTAHGTSEVRKSSLVDLEEMISGATDSGTDEPQVKDAYIEEKEVFLPTKGKSTDFERLAWLIADTKLHPSNGLRSSRTPYNSQETSPEPTAREIPMASLDEMTSAVTISGEADSELEEEEDSLYYDADSGVGKLAPVEVVVQMEEQEIYLDALENGTETDLEKLASKLVS